MINTPYFFALICLLNLFFQVKTSAQLFEVFLDKPDKNIKKVTAKSIDDYKDTSKKFYYVAEYNKKGLLIKESQPEYYVEVSYNYDNKDRLVEKEALYGESFANGTTTYLYKSSITFEKTLAMGFYETIEKVYSSSEKIKKQITTFVSSGMGESKIEYKKYHRNNKGLIQKIETKTEYHDYEKEPGEVVETDMLKMENELKNASIIRKVYLKEVYTYDTKNKLSSKILYDENSGKELLHVNYKYNNSGLLTEESQKCVQQNNKKLHAACRTYKKINEYDKKGLLIKVTTTYQNSVNEDYYKKGKLIKQVSRYNNENPFIVEFSYHYFD